VWVGPVWRNIRFYTQSKYQRAQSQYYSGAARLLVMMELTKRITNFRNLKSILFLPGLIKGFPNCRSGHQHGMFFGYSYHMHSGYGKGYRNISRTMGSGNVEACSFVRGVVCREPCLKVAGGRAHPRSALARRATAVRS